MNRKKREYKRKGSLLLEALLSIIILSTSISLVIRAMTSSLRATRYSADYTEAMFLLENEFFDILSEGFVVADEQGEKRLEEPYEKYSCSIESEEFEDAIMPTSGEDIPVILEVGSDISWKSGRKENKLTIQTFLFEDNE